MALKKTLTARILIHVGVLAAYTALAFVFCRPLWSFFATRFILCGPAAGSVNHDLGLDVWNMWHFHYAISVLKSNPLWTNLQYYPYGANLILTHYTIFNDVIAFFLLPHLGIFAVHNLLYLSAIVLSGYGVFLLLTDYGLSAESAFLGGFALALSPAAQYWYEGSLEMCGFHTIAFFLWTFSRAMRRRKGMDCFWAALCLTWIWCYNYYHFLFAVLFIGFSWLWMEKPVAFSLSRRSDAGWLKLARHALDFCLLADGALVFHSLLVGQRKFHGSGTFRDLVEYTAPYLAFWALTGLKVFSLYLPSIRVRAQAFFRRALLPYLGTIGFWIIINLPLVVASIFFIASGDYSGGTHAWRGGGNPTDLMWFFIFPSTLHWLWGPALGHAMQTMGLGSYNPLTGYYPYLGWTILGAAAWLWKHGRKDERTAFWFASAAFGCILSLGPWLKVCGVQTYLPLPFYFIHLLPVFSSMQGGDHFNIYPVFFLSFLFAVGVDEWRAKHSGQSVWLVPLAAFALLFFEYIPGPARFYQWNIPPIIARLARRPQGAMLTLPAGAAIDGLDAQGDIGEPPDMMLQTIHHKPVLGGYLGRISRRTYLNIKQDPFFSAIIAAQAGAPPGPLLSRPHEIGLYLRGERLRYVLVEKSEVSPALLDVLPRWPMRLIDQQDDWQLYEVDKSL